MRTAPLLAVLFGLLVATPGSTQIVNHTTLGLTRDILVLRDTGWVPCPGGLLAVDANGNLVAKYTTADGLPTTACGAAALDSSGDLWIAAYGYLFMRANSAWPATSLQDGYYDMTPLDVEFGADGTVYICDDADGLGVLSNDSLRFLTRIDGLLSDRVNDVEIDESGLLWLATSRGVCTWREGVLRRILRAVARC